MSGVLGLPPCPCGSALPYAGCCGPLHDGAPAATAEALMRSRYAAYVLGRVDHLTRTWHPRTRPLDLGGADDLTWTGLVVRETTAGGVDDEEGEVAFEASWRGATGAGVLRERSRFVRRAGRWVYLDGTDGGHPTG